MMEKRNCIHCGKVITGRSDKKYCDAYCKSSQQYELRKQNEHLYLKIDKQLKTNRKILKKYNRQGRSTIRKDVLISEGFDPNYFTHFWKSKKANVYLFCYEFGFLSINENNKDKYLLILWQDYMEK